MKLLTEINKALEILGFTATIAPLPYGDEPDGNVPQDIFEGYIVDDIFYIYTYDNEIGVEYELSKKESDEDFDFVCYGGGDLKESVIDLMTALVTHKLEKAL